jgi:hypothetical protein
MPTLPTVVSGDFNLHHLLWDLYDRLEPQADSLLQLDLQWSVKVINTTAQVSSAECGRRMLTLSTHGGVVVGGVGGYKEGKRAEMGCWLEEKIST